MLNIVKASVVTIVVVISTLTLIVLLQKHSPKDVSEDIVSLENMHIAPLEISKQPVPNFSNYADITDKKRAFFAYLQPEIHRQNKIVLKEREMVFALQETFLQQQVFNKHQQETMKTVGRVPILFNSVQSLSKSAHVCLTLSKPVYVCPRLSTTVHGCPRLSQLCTTNTTTTTADPSGQLKPIQARSPNTPGHS